MNLAHVGGSRAPAAASPRSRKASLHRGPDELSDAFWNACRAAQLTAARYLLARGADLNWPAPWSGETPLDAARARDEDDMVAWLTAEGATSGA